MEKKHVLVKFKAISADDESLEIFGMQVFEKDKWEDIINDDSLKEEMDDGYVAPVGETGLEVEFEDFEDFQSCLEVVDISEQEAKFLKEKVVGKDGYGHWILDDIL